MATLTVNIEVRVEDNGVLCEMIPMNGIALETSGPFLRRSVNLTAEDYTTLDVGELTPKYWYLKNVHATNDLVIGWGVTDILTLSPGDPPCWFRSSQTPYAKGATAASRLLYAVYT